MNHFFVPAEGRTTTVANSATATAAVELPYDCSLIALTNSSATATTFVRVTYFNSASDTMTGVAPTATADYPIPPNTQVIRAVQNGKHKVIRTIASAADGNIYITPGHAV